MGTQRTIRWRLPLTSSHPAAHGGFAVDLVLDDDSVVAADPVPGAMHRGAEKLFESRDYRAALTLADRHDWLGSFGSELSLAQLLEQQLGIAVPARAQWLRVLLAEYTRITHHLLWLAATLEQLGSPAAHVGHTARERLLELLEDYCGARMHLMVARIGGLRTDASADWLTAIAAAVSTAREAAAELDRALLAAADGLAGVAVLASEDAAAYAVTGPVARAAGHPRDLRLTEDGVYAQLRGDGTLRACGADGGDALARLRLLVDEVAVSADCVLACAQRLAEVDGPVQVPLPRSIRVPEGHSYHAGENPSGINGWYLVSKGAPTPYRLKVRSSSFGNAASLATSLPGTRMADLPIALMSYLLVAGDTDR